MIFLFTISSAWMTTAMTIAMGVVLTILTIGVALAIGLLLRRALVRRLKKTVLDSWIVQTLGVIVVLIPLFIASFGIPLEWQPTLIFYYWDVLKSQFGLQGFPIKLIILNFLGTILLLVLGIGIARTLQRLIMRNLTENHLDVNIRTLIGRIFYFLVLIFTFFWILSIWNVALTVPVALVGVITVAIGVSLQDIVKNLVAGVYILAERPFHIGDQINTFTTTNYTGEVRDIQLRTTKLRLVSGEEVSIPNSLIFSSIIVNNTYYSDRRATITATLPHEEYIKNETSQHVKSAIQEIKHVSDKPVPSVSISNYTATTITLTIRFWIALHETEAVSDVMYTLHALLPNAELVVQESAGNV